MTVASAQTKFRGRRDKRRVGGGAPSLLANIVWVILIGIWEAMLYATAGLAFCVTVVGIPFGLQLFKMAKLSLMPFGATVRNAA